MYRKFRDDPSSVDASWHEFLVDYNPEPTVDAPAAVTAGRTGSGPAASRAHSLPAACSTRGTVRVRQRCAKRTGARCQTGRPATRRR